MQQAVIFVRVSKKEQDYQRQVEDLRAVAQSRAVQVVAEIAGKMSGARRNQDRAGNQRRRAASSIGRGNSGEKREPASAKQIYFFL